MTNVEALQVIRDFYLGKECNARDVSTAMFIVSCSIDESATMDDLKEFVLNFKTPWLDRRTSLHSR